MGPQIIRCYEGDAAQVTVNVNPASLARWDYDCDTNPPLLGYEYGTDWITLTFKPKPGIHKVTVKVDTTNGHRFKRQAVIDCETASWLHDCGFPG